MNRFTRLAALAGTFVFAGAVLGPAAAQYATDYTPPKLLRQGKTAHAIAGTGTVIVQVQVNANGSHKATRILKSTNRGDNAAAMDIAANSTYRIALRGKKPITAYYDFTLKFRGKSAAVADTGPESGPTLQIARMIRAGNYAGAKAAAMQYLATNPSDTTALAQLGVADFYANDFAGAAAAFAKDGTIAQQYQAVAAHAYATAAAQGKDPVSAVDYGKRAVALDTSANSYYGLGVAELNAGDAASAAVNLKKARDLAFADSKTGTREKVTLDTELFAAYVKNNDMADARTLAAQIKQLDPTSTVPQRILGNQLLTAGTVAGKAGKHDDAIASFLQAGTSGDRAVEVTGYTLASFEEGRKDKPDYAKAKGYADKALAINADDAQANFAEGVSISGQWVNGGGKDAGLKSQAMGFLNKAESLAESAGNIGLKLQIQNFIKGTFK